MQYRIVIASVGYGGGGIIFIIDPRSIICQYRSASIICQLIFIGDVAILALGKSPPVGNSRRPSPERLRGCYTETGHSHRSLVRKR